MKKLFYLLFLLVIIPINVYANDGSGDFQPYKAIVSAKNGTILTKFMEENTKINIPYDTELVINYEYIDNGILYGDTIYDNINGSINLSDTILKTDYYVPTDKQKIKEVEKVYVYRKTGVKMYAGPSMKYEEIVTVPFDTILSYQYYDDSNQWIYTTYNNHSGWILYSQQPYITEKYNTTSGLAVIEDGNIYTVNNEVKIYENPFDESSKVLLKLPQDVIADYKYSTPYDENDCQWLYVSYQETQGWIKYSLNQTDETSPDSIVAIGNKNGTDSKVLITNKNGVSIFSNTTYSNNIGTIPKNKIATVFFHYSNYSKNNEYYYVEYNGKKGWITETDNNELIYGYYEEEYTTKDDTTLYEEYSTDSKAITTIPKNYKLSSLFEYYDLNTENNWEYVTYNNKSGWIIFNRNNDDDISSDYESSLTEQISNNFKPNEFVTICISSAIGLSLISFIAIKLISKRKDYQK